MEFSKEQGQVSEDGREHATDEPGAAGAESAGGAGEAVPGPDGEPQAGVAVEEDTEQKWQARVAELEDRLLRVHADFDNFRRRTRQEKEELLTLANTKLAGDLLPVLDNFALALQAAGSASDAESIAKGVEMVYKQFVGLLENLGLRAMEPIGQAFDPSLHEAVVAESAAGREPGTVLAVMRTGYYFKDKVLRPAMVKVSE